jgi:uncharacterized membrane protein
VSTHRGWLVFGLAGIALFVVALVPMVTALAGGYLFAFEPLVELQAVIAATLVAPMFAVSARFQRHVLALEPQPRAAVDWSCRAITQAACAIAAVLGIAPGLCFADPRRGVLAAAIVIAVAHVAMRKLGGVRRAWRSTWLAICAYGMITTIATTTFALVF